jgi:type II secretory pathway pseudopilin PulG
VVALTQKTAGATLLEMLLVMTIMVTMFSLIAGTTVDLIDRAAGQTEVIAVYSSVKKASIRAFSSGNSVLLKFSDAYLEIYVGDQLQYKKTFEHLNFNTQVLRFNRNGMTDTLSIHVDMRGIDKTIDLRPIFNSTARFEFAHGADFAG